MVAGEEVVEVEVVGDLHDFNSSVEVVGDANLHKLRFI